jgi:hypothetical protein
MRKHLSIPLTILATALLATAILVTFNVKPSPPDTALEFHPMSRR